MDSELAKAQIKSLLANKAKFKQSANSTAIKCYMAGVAGLSKVLQFNKANDLQTVKAAAKTAAKASHIQLLN